MAMAATATATAAAVRYAPEDPTLPKPWRGLVDGRTGYLYFWNPETNVTQYERPSITAPPKSSSVPISSSVKVQQPSQGQRHGYGPEKEDDRYSRGANCGSKLEVGTRGNQVDFLLVSGIVTSTLYITSCRSLPISHDNCNMFCAQNSDHLWKS